MKLLLDVHIAAAIARVLMENGHEVLRAAFEHANWTDEELLDLAVREERFIVTEDRDFSDLIYAHGMPPPPRHHLHPLRTRGAARDGDPSSRDARIRATGSPYGGYPPIKHSLPSLAQGKFYR